VAGVALGDNIQNVVLEKKKRKRPPTEAASI